MLTIGIVGSRRRTSNKDQNSLIETLDKFLTESKVKKYRLVSGGCPQGADAMAEFIAKSRGLTIIIHYPDWVKNGKAAGFIRNTSIAQDCDVLIAVVASDRTGGTEDTIKKAEKLGKPVIIC